MSIPLYDKDDIRLKVIPYIKTILTDMCNDIQTKWKYVLLKCVQNTMNTYIDKYGMQGDEETNVLAILALLMTMENMGFGILFQCSFGKIQNIKNEIKDRLQQQLYLKLKQNLEKINTIKCVAIHIDPNELPEKYQNRTDIDFTHIYDLDDEFTIHRELGKGTFGTVYSATSKTNNKQYALKLSNFENTNIQQIIREFDVVKALGLDCHIGFICYEKLFFARSKQQGNKIVPVSQMELIHGKDLSEILNEYYDNHENFSRNELLSKMYKLISVLAKIHEKGFAHKDIKPQNIMIESQTGKPVLIDLGLMCKADDKNIDDMTIVCDEPLGTISYASPSVQKWMQLYLKQKEFSIGQILQMTKTLIPGDVYSMGYVFYNMANPGFNPYDLSYYRPLENVDEDISEIIFEMLDKNDKTRPTAKQVRDSIEQLSYM
jgi:serine/threonine protein kinase